MVLKLTSSCSRSLLIVSANTLLFRSLPTLYSDLTMDSNVLDVLEDMALAVCSSDNSSEQAVRKWTALGYTRAEGEAALTNINRTKKFSQRFTPSELRQTVYMVLAYPLDTAAKVQEAAALDYVPEIKEGKSEETGKGVRMCRVGVRGRCAIEDWIAQQRLLASFFFINVNRAIKEFDACGPWPRLGISSATLPQYRPSREEVFRPGQDEYPVWYFFYGVLADPEDNYHILRQVLGLSLEDKMELRDAWIRGGKVKRWGEYKALVDSGDMDVVKGKAYLVKTRWEEEDLMLYETSAYDVVRCKIFFKGMTKEADGCVFRIGEGVAAR